MNKKLSFLFILLTLNILMFGQIPTGSLVAYWPFNGNANDLSGNNNNGIVNGATLTADRFGNCGMAYAFDGSNDKIVIPNASSIDMTNSTNFSVCFWMKTSVGASLIGTMLCKNQYGSQSGYQFLTYPGWCGGNGKVSFYTAGGQNACSNGSICAGTNQNVWFFVTGVYNSNLNISNLYINGIPQNGNGNLGFNLSTSEDLHFGCQTNSSEFFNGVLDDIRIYKKVLTAPEIVALFNESNPVASLTATNTTPAQNQIVCVGNSATLSAITSTNATDLYWYSSPTSTLPVGMGNSYVTPPLAPGSYTYYVKPVNCAGTSSVSLPVTFTVSTCLSVKTNHSEANLAHLFPNPTNGELNIEISREGIISIRNMLGEQVLEEKISEGKNKIDIKRLSNGIYFIEMKQAVSTQTFKIIKE